MSFFILAFGCGLFSIAPNLSFLFLASFVEMFSVGLSGPAISALVADCSAQCSRGKAFGIFNLSWVAAQVPAPLLGGFLAETVNLRSPFIIAVFVSVVGMMFSILLKGNLIRTTKDPRRMKRHLKSQIQSHSCRFCT